MADYYAIAEARERECRIQARAYSMWLSTLRPINVVLVVGAAVLSTIAGAAVLATTEWGTLPGYLALASAVFTVIHTRLDCDVHQAECRRLRSAYDAQAYHYRSLRILDEPADIQRGIRELDVSQASLRAEAKATPPNWAIGRAERQEREAAALKS